MELKKHLDLRSIFVGLYVLVFVIYAVVGLRPVDAVDYEIVAELAIPAIGLEADVTKITLQNGKLNTPDSIVGSFSRNEHTTLLFGHSTTVFQHLDSAKLGDEIIYAHDSYYITDLEVKSKSDISMKQLLNSNTHDTLVLMTCAGKLLNDGDATHRLIITATKY